MALPKLVTATPTDSVVVFSELMYHPSAGGDEWIELYNQMGVDIDLSGWRLAGGINYRFPDGMVIAAGDYLVVSSLDFAGSLDNGGEVVELRNNSERLMDLVAYGDDSPWPVGADGSGASLAKLLALRPSGDPAEWRASIQLGGSPGAENFPMPGGTISEVLLDWGAQWRYNETGTDQGSGWSSGAHDAGGVWKRGAGPIGWDNTPPPIPFATELTPPPLNPGVITFYFETEFDLSSAQLEGLRALKLVHLIDDGAVFYLNGVEVARFEMPRGAVRAETLSTGSGDAQVSAAITIPSGALVAGENRLSVEVHQASAGSNDVVCGVRLLVDYSPRATAETLVLSEVSEAGAADFRVELMNLGGDEEALGGYVLACSSGARYEFPDGALVGGGFRVLDVAELGFVPLEGERLFLLRPGGTELADGRKVTGRLRGRAEAMGGRWLFPSVESFGAANVFEFSEDVVINEIMYHARPSFPSPGIPATYASEIVVPGDATWKYEQSGTLPGADWMSAGFDDRAWSSGTGALGVESGVLPEPIRTDLNLGAVSYYFRTSFEYAGDPAVDALRLRLQVDDGAVIYINGTEVLRPGMPAGAITPSTLASTAVGNAIYQDFVLPENLLVEGDNVIAAEVHQSSITSSDVVFALELVAAVQVDPGVPATLFAESAEEWVELFNRGGEEIDLAGWKLGGGIEFAFPPGTMLESGGYLVIARDLAAFAAAHPGVPAVGGYGGKLSNGSDRIALDDPHGNPADEVHFFDGGRWDSGADGYGPSLELRDPDADNACGEAWQASDEAAGSAWGTYRYRTIASTPVSGAPTLWREFAFGLLHNEGEILIDDVSVVEDPDGAAIERLGNGDFSAGATGWRLLGNHQRSVIEDGVLHLVASGPAEYQGNQIETTLAGGAAITNGAEYEISFRARWLSGASHLNARLYFNRGAASLGIAVPTGNGTPGMPNSRLIDNAGPTFVGFQHAPLLPPAGQPVTVSVRPSDPDGIATAVLHYRKDGNAWSEVPMGANGGGSYSGLIPGQSPGSIVQFYVEATDGLGASSLMPAAGEASRALFEVDDGVGANGAVHDLRAIMLSTDSDYLHLSVNTRSNELLGGTVFYAGEAFYDIGVRLKGSFVGRDVARVGFNLKFNPDQLFRGVHGKVAIDRSTHANLGIDEVIIKHIANRAGDIPGMYDDIVQFIAPRSQHNQRSLLRLAGFDDIYLDSQYENGSDGTVFEFEVYRWATQTVDGNPESLKAVGPNGYSNVPFGSLGDDKEDYRWHCLITSHRRRDDYSSVIPFLKVFSLSGAALEAAAPAVMDVDAVLRTLAYQTLVGPADCTYTGGADHNFRLYARPDGKVIYLPWDWDSSFQKSTSAPLVGGGRLASLVNRPAHLRLYYGHLKNIIEKAFNTDYMADWTAHYGALGGQNFGNRLSYIGARASFVLGQLPGRVPFAITSQGGSDFSVAAPRVVLSGNGWIDVREIRTTPTGEPLSVTWTDADSWNLTLPISIGANPITLLAFDGDGNQVGSDSITVTNTSATGVAGAGNLVISEVMYHPVAGAGEFIEVMNISDSGIDLSGVYFADGIEFAFAEGTQLAPGGRLVVDEFASGMLNNAGERLVLVAGDGSIIRDFSYSDSLPWPVAPDGGGPSLVLIDPLSNPDHSLATNWRASVKDGGNPGGTDATQFGGVAGADLDGNRIDDLIDYALGHAPGAGDGVPMISAAGVVSISYPENLAADDVTVGLEWSGDLAAWRPIGDGSGFSLASLEAIGDGRQRRRYEATEDPVGGRRFFRLRVSE